MARPKGSKNRKETVNVDERIAQIDAEIEALQAQIKTKKAERTKLKAVKSAEDQKKLVAAVQKSGMSIDEIIELIKKD